MSRRRSKGAQNVPLDKERAFRLIFRQKTNDMVWGWLMRLEVPERDRMDVLQDVFCSAHQSFHTYDPMRSRPERWLNKITVHVAAHYRDRAQHRREELRAEVPLAADANLPAPERIQAEQDRLLLGDLLQAVEPEHRSVLVAHDIDGIPMSEIAEQHEIPLSTAYKWRVRALVVLEEAYRRREDEHA